MAEDEGPTDEGEDVVYELEDWPDELLDELEDDLAQAEIPYAWDDDGGLVIAPADADRVEEMLDRLERLPGEPEPVAGAVDYDVLSELFVAVDRFVDDPYDADLSDALVAAARTVEATVPPYGFEPQEWARVKGMAATVSRDLRDGADGEVVEAGARDLRDLLRRYV